MLINSHSICVNYVSSVALFWSNNSEFNRIFPKSHFVYKLNKLIITTHIDYNDNIFNIDITSWIHKDYVMILKLFENNHNRIMLFLFTLDVS